MVLGEEDAFRTVYVQHHTAVYRYVRRRVPPDEAADVTAEVFTTVWRRFGDLPRERVLPWVYGIARNTVANHLRARQSAPTAVTVGEPVTAAVARDVGEQVAARDTVRRAWSVLSAADHARRLWHATWGNRSRPVTRSAGRGRSCPRPTGRYSP
ncbi:RNA polymerase sigma factor [Kitasatospora purpeofusca]|uniref:RNA polymerase sigma factor n=1 Tax=Kitasatospora purpeofusca TaxID=67352 RepID=UPI0038601834